MLLHHPFTPYIGMKGEKGQGSLGGIVTELWNLKGTYGGQGEEH
jgi:hypothetical protein